METLRIDRTKCVTVANYAKQREVTPQAVYNWIKEKKVASVEIDGVIFVYKQ